MAVVQNVQIGPCLSGSLTITGTPGDVAWVWAGPTTFESPAGLDVQEYTYYLLAYDEIGNVTAVSTGERCSGTLHSTSSPHASTAARTRIPLVSKNSSVKLSAIDFSSTRRPQPTMP